MQAHFYDSLPGEAVTEENLSAIRAYLQQKRTWGCDSFHAMIEANTRCFAGVRQAYWLTKTVN